MKKKRLLIGLCVLILGGCSAQPQSAPLPDPVSAPSALPEKSVPQSALMSNSPISPTNLDDYLFLKDVLYFDLRSPAQLAEEGSVAGFVNIPFYGVLVDYERKDNVLYRMTKVRDDQGQVIAQMGDVGSFSANYEESESLIRDLFPQDQPIVFISTAGVEAAYMICLLQQLGYDGSKLYNAGTFSNGMGNIIAYKDYPDAKYHVPGTNVYTVSSQFLWSETLTPAADE